MHRVPGPFWGLLGFFMSLLTYTQERHNSSAMNSLFDGADARIVDAATSNGILSFE
jgi:hypothetical protein